MYFKKYCSICAPKTHCCTFDHNAGFTFVGIQDAKKIQKETKKEYTDFLDFSPLPKATLRLLKKEDPALEGALRYSQLDNKNRILRLKKQKDGKCIFLKNKKCSIYQFRPKICRIYPYWAMRLLDNSLKIIEHDTTKRCPIIQADEQILKKQSEELKKIFTEIERETVHYQKEIKKFVKKLDS